jgi:cytochrome c oxidase assembly protein Cox11
MTTRNRQTGMSILGMLCILLMLGFFAMCIIRMAPVYFEYLSVRDIIQRIAMETDPATESASDVRRKISNIFNTNQIYKLKPQEVEIYVKEGKTYIDANYEVRLPVMWRIDSILMFDDLLYEVGNPVPLPKPPVSKK